MQVKTELKLTAIKKQIRIVHIWINILLLDNTMVSVSERGVAPAVSVSELVRIKFIQIANHGVSVSKSELPDNVYWSG